MTKQTIDTTNVTQEQRDRCTKILDLNRNEPFYMVLSESDDLTEYAVRWSKLHGFTCTCKAGQQGFANCRQTCKHIRWALSAAQEEKRAMRPLDVLERTERAALISFIIRDGDTCHAVFLHSHDHSADFCYCTPVNANGAHDTECAHLAYARQHEVLWHAEMAQWAKEIAA